MKLESYLERLLQVFRRYRKVGEALDEETTGVTVVNRVGGGKSEHRFHRVVHGVDELSPETRSLRFVPLPSGLDVRQGGRKEPDPLHWNQLRSRRLASSQEMTSAMPLSRESSR